MFNVLHDYKHFLWANELNLLPSFTHTTDHDMLHCLSLQIMRMSFYLFHLESASENAQFGGARWPIPLDPQKKYDTLPYTGVLKMEEPGPRGVAKGRNWDCALLTV